VPAGFATDTSVLSAAGVQPGSKADPNPFFKAVFAKKYLNKLAISPHVVSKRAERQSGPSSLR
jgi:hypothetical protein